MSSFSSSISIVFFSRVCDFSNHWQLNMKQLNFYHPVDMPVLWWCSGESWFSRFFFWNFTSQSRSRVIFISLSLLDLDFQSFLFHFHFSKRVKGKKISPFFLEKKVDNYYGFLAKWVPFQYVKVTLEIFHLKVASKRPLMCHWRLQVGSWASKKSFVENAF